MRDHGSTLVRRFVRAPGLTVILSNVGGLLGVG